MKTTIELPDSLFTAAKRRAQRDKVTLRALVEEGLRYVLSGESSKSTAAFKLQDASVSGQRQVTVASDWLRQEDDHATARFLRTLANDQSLGSPKRAAPASGRAQRAQKKTK
jgi:hypothetical protein